MRVEGFFFRAEIIIIAEAINPQFLADMDGLRSFPRFPNFPSQEANSLHSLSMYEHGRLHKYSTSNMRASHSSIMIMLLPLRPQGQGFVSCPARCEPPPLGPEHFLPLSLGFGSRRINYAPYRTTQTVLLP
ncbi:unnamed protein product [Tuber aestivum]|uniref:Uncharacterized protein n=1 Tax=Tuber aestivum TaxID=59557 RepID=A0A292PRM4_9PEZI|nr:unnamed protein product [Tuber aestivum]